MIFVPSELINENNFYSYHDNTLTVYSECINDNCVCNDVYIDYDYNISESYVCSKDTVVMLSSSPTSDFYYRQDFWSILFIFLTFCFVIIYCPLKILLRFFKRFN